MNLTLWQRRYREHQIRDENDFIRHVEYIHHNPVKHGLCERPIQWPHSALHNYVREGKYVADWAVKDSSFEALGFGE